jgi:hypothetical protein
VARKPTVGELERRWDKLAERQEDLLERLDRVRGEMRSTLATINRKRAAEGRRPPMPRTRTAAAPTRPATAPKRAPARDDAAKMAALERARAKAGVTPPKARRRRGGA